ncbi:MAG: copper oxidase, partial [Legionella sp.]
MVLMPLLTTSGAFAADRQIELRVEYQKVQFTGKVRPAITVNGQIPAPTLKFKQGDKVSIHVYNHLDKPTAIHWHGLLVPWQMDGVMGVTQKG